MKEKERTRIKWVDELKGAVLVFICLGHITGMIYAPPSLKFLSGAITIMGVPAFFFLSGLLFQKRNDSSKQYIAKKTKALLIPYILLSMLFTILDPYTYNPSYLIKVLHYPKVTLPEFMPLDDYYQASIEFLLGDILCTTIGISSRATLPMWFVFVLYFVTISFFWVQNRYKSQKIVAIIALSCYCLALVMNKFGIGGFFKTGPILMAFFFYWLGVLSSKHLNRLGESPLFILLVPSVALLCLFFMTAPSLIDQVYFVNGIFPIDMSLFFLSSSLFGISGTLLLFASLSKISFIGFDMFKGVLRNIARNSLIILCMHYVLLVFFSLYLKTFFPESWHIFVAVGFIILGCIGAIAVFRTKLYMFIGGEHARQNLRTCLSCQ